MAGQARSWQRAVGVLLVCLAVGLALMPGVEASPWPPAEGDWVIEEWEEITLTDVDLTLPGSIYVYGHLILDNCVLRFAPSGFADKGLFVLESGRVEGTDTWVTSTSHESRFEGVAAMAAGGTSVNVFTRCRFDPVCGSFHDQSHNTFTGCEFASGVWTVFGGDSQNVLLETTFGFDTYAVFGDRSVNSATECFFGAYWTVGGWAKQDSRNTFTDCTFKGFEFHSPSVSTVQGCDFVALNPDGTGGRLSIYAREDTVLSLSDLAPGYLSAYVIQASNNPFRVELMDVSVHEVVVKAEHEADLALTRCELTDLWCNGHSRTEAVDTQIDMLVVYTYGQRHAANVIVRNFRDGGVSQTVDITSDNSPFLLSFRNSSVWASAFAFGDTGDPVTPSHNLIEDSSIWKASVCHHSSLTIVRSTLSAAVARSQGGCLGDASAELVVEDSILTGLLVEGPLTSAFIRRSELTGQLFFWSWADWCDPPILSSPAVHFEASAIGPGDSRVWVRPDVVGARVSGDVGIDPSRVIVEWAPGSTVTRQFPMRVLDAEGQPVEGAGVRVTDGWGRRVWIGETGPDGYAYPEVTFGDANYDSEFRVSANAGGLSGSAPLGFLSSTPIGVSLATHPVSYTSFEEARFPWSVFRAGLDEAATWR